MKSINCKSNLDQKKLLSQKLELEVKDLEENLKKIEEFIDKDEKPKSSINKSKTKLLIKKQDEKEVSELTAIKNEKAHKQYLEKTRQRDLAKIEAEYNKFAKQRGKKQIDLIPIEIKQKEKTTQDEFKKSNKKLLLDDLSIIKNKNILQQNEQKLTKQSEIYTISKENNNSEFDSKSVIYNKSETELEKDYWNSLSDNKRKEYKIKYGDIYQILKPLNLTRFTGLFVEEGFDTIEMFKMLNVQILEQLGFDKNKVDSIVKIVNNSKPNEEKQQLFKEIKQINENENSKEREIFKTEIKYELHDMGVEANMSIPLKINKVYCWYCFKSVEMNKCLSITYSEAFYENKVVFFLIIEFLQLNM